ncbi:MAG: lysoplasmalogenase, partial [Prevotellaceae bacterium]|nr:lysoplasmalogenase [Prevotellaceae bacterium]
LFFAAHAGFLLFALKNGKCAMRGLPYIMAPCLVFFALALYPAIDNTVLLIAVLLYLLVSCCSLAAAMNMKSDRFVRGFFIAGISCIVFSDTLIALAEFSDSSALSFLIMPTYYLSHILITLSVLQLKTDRQPSCRK